ncbi:Detected protein of unknown function [Hibiscus syriacus]|uniref:Uncharacterized protein n=1 Tax=Hibiscus syriacus TaxID=106335 RepID=A0A6A2ZJR6_HIBSY|nr:uncharacterized protein LOC120143807 [Hibiscus syriacus]KAE8691973.1 Detected protein of unknown function [Hibiscus syriacus]
MRSMVYSDETEMAMGSHRLNPLHNFKLPCLKWGNQRHLRCMKLGHASTAAVSSSSFVDLHLLRRFHVVQRRRSPPSSKFEGLMVGGTRRQESESYPSNDYGREGRVRVTKGEAAEEIEAVREKIMKDLKTAADKIKDEIFRDKASDGDEVEAGENEFEEPKLKRKEKEREKSPAVEVKARPWNLRTRRAACKAPIDGGGMNNNYNYATRNEVINSLRVRDRGQPVVSAAADEKKRERPEFSVTLSKQEIEEDFMVMVGRRPRKRPKKRRRYLQNELDSLFPGLQLTEVTVDSYKVPELIGNGNASSNIQTR